MKKMLIIAAWSVFGSNALADTDRGKQLALADTDRGKQLHDEHCTQCHDTSVYTRENRFVSGPDALTTQVQHCHSNVGVQWSEEDIKAVVQYLDKSFYKFKQQ